MSDPSQFTGRFRLEKQAKTSFTDAASVSAELLYRTLSAMRDVSNTLPVNFSNFQEHVYFNSAELKTKAAIRRLINEYPVGISGQSTASLNATHVGLVDNYMMKLNGFEQYVLKYLGGVTGDPYLYPNPTLTSMATGLSGNIPLIYLARNSQNVLTGYQVSLSSNIIYTAQVYDSGLNTVRLMSGTGIDFMVNYYDDGNFYTSQVLPSQVLSSVNRQSNMIDWVPSAYYVGDEDTDILKKFMSVVGAILDDIKLYINQFSNINHISYDDYNRVPDGEIMNLVAKHFGFHLVDTLIRGDLSPYLRREQDKLILYKVASKLWNRVLNNLIYLYKKKGTLEAVKALIRTYGLPDTYLQIDDYSFHSEPAIQDKVEYKNVRMLWFDGNSWIRFPASSTDSFWTKGANQDFAVEVHVSTTSLSSNTNIFYSGSTSGGYNLFFDGQSLIFNTWDGGGNNQASTTSSSSATLRNALTTQFVNISCMRGGSFLLIQANWIDDSTVSAIYTGLIGLGVLGGGSLALSSNNHNTFIGSSGTGNGWVGYISELKSFNFSYSLDIKEHTYNFESMSWMNSAGGSLGGVLGEWKLRENQVLTGQYYTVNSWPFTPSNTGQAFGTISATNQYRMVEGVRKETTITTAGDFVEDNIGTYVDATNMKNRKSNIVHIGFRPVNAVNNDIINIKGDIDIPSIVGDPINFYNNDPAALSEWYGYDTMVASAHEVFSRYFISGKPTKIALNDYIQALENLSPVIVGIVESIKQLVPVRSQVLNRGITIEPHLLERSRMPKPIDTFTPYEINTDTINQPYVDNWQYPVDLNMNLTNDNTLSAGSQSTRDVSYPTVEQLLYLSNYASTNYPRAVGNVGTDPYLQYVSNYADTSVLITLNRNWLNNSEFISVGGLGELWQASITGNVKLLRASSGKPIVASESTVRFDLPHNTFGSPVSATENYFNFTVGTTACSTTAFSFEYNIPSTRGLNFIITPNSNYYDVKIGLQQLVITNILNGKTSQIPIIISTDESGFGGTLTLETQITV